MQYPRGSSGNALRYWACAAEPARADGLLGGAALADQVRLPGQRHRGRDGDHGHSWRPHGDQSHARCDRGVGGLAAQLAGGGVVNDHPHGGAGTMVGVP
jgi:hypothetical protein